MASTLRTPFSPAANSRSDGAGDPLPWGRGGWLSDGPAREALGLGCLCLACYLLLACATFHPLDPSFNQAVDKGASIHNGAGRLGAYLAGALHDLLGVGAFFLPIFLLLLGLTRLLRGLRLGWRRWTGLALVASAVMAVGGGSWGARHVGLGAMEGGGFLGRLLAGVSEMTLSPMVAGVFWGALLLLGLQWLSGERLWVLLPRLYHLGALAWDKHLERLVRREERRQLLREGLDPDNLPDTVTNGRDYLFDSLPPPPPSLASASAPPQTQPVLTRREGASLVSPPPPPAPSAQAAPFAPDVRSIVEAPVSVPPLPSAPPLPPLVETSGMTNDAGYEAVQGGGFVQSELNDHEEEFVVTAQHGMPSRQAPDSEFQVAHFMDALREEDEARPRAERPSQAGQHGLSGLPANFQAIKSSFQRMLGLIPDAPVPSREQEADLPPVLTTSPIHREASVDPSAGTAFREPPASPPPPPPAAPDSVAAAPCGPSAHDDPADAFSMEAGQAEPEAAGQALEYAAEEAACPPPAFELEEVPVFDRDLSQEEYLAGPRLEQPEAAPLHEAVLERADLPPLELLAPAPAQEHVVDPEELARQAERLTTCLADFNVQGEVMHITPGPVVTMFEYKPAPGVKISKIANLSDDLALALKALSVRIEAPIPGKDMVGVEIPSQVRETVFYREILESEAFTRSESLLTLALGKDIAGAATVADLARMPHLLVAGATGAGKSVCLNSILLSFLYKATPDEVKLLLIDPKRIELAVYADLPHLVHPVVTEMALAKNALDWAVHEMDQRYQAMARLGARNIQAFNEKLARRRHQGDLPDDCAELEPMPFLVIVIDELADLMLTAAKEVETSVVRLAQLARAAGIHMILATQRPSVDVVTGLIKANFPCRISFQVTSKHDSRTILDTVGSERLLGKGDMLYKPGGGKLQRLHGCFVSDDDVTRVVEFWKRKQPPSYALDFAEWGGDAAEEEGVAGGPGDLDTDPKYKEAVDFVTGQGKASISLIQRRFRIGFNRAARYVEQMEVDGIVGPADGVKARPVLRSS